MDESSSDVLIHQVVVPGSVSGSYYIPVFNVSIVSLNRRALMHGC